MQLLMTSLLDNPIILEIDTVSKKKKERNLGNLDSS